MAPKKQAKNAFHFFLVGYVDSQRQKGRNISLKTGVEECSPLWKNLSEGEKQKYKTVANAVKEKMIDNSLKQNTLGETLNEAQLYEQLEEEKTEACDREIKMTIGNLDENKLSTHLFYLVHCNYYCKTDYEVYVPGELAICEFNLRDGIKRTYHVLINPGKIPLGFAYEAQLNIKEVHGLPYPPYSEGNQSFSSILNDVLHFLSPGKLPDGQYPPVYCISKNICATESILNKLSEKENKILFRVYPMYKMFFTLKNKCVENKTSENQILGFPVMSNAILEEEKDIFCYVPGISCGFHANIEDLYHSCSLSVVQRYVYVICDHCCQELNISIIPGKHSRLNCDLNRKETCKKIEEEYKKTQGTKANSVPEKSAVSGLCSYFGGNDVPEWTKITSNSFFDYEFSKNTRVKKGNETTYASVSLGGGKKFVDLDGSNYDSSFPELTRERRLTWYRK